MLETDVAPRLRLGAWRGGGDDRPPSPFPHMEAHACWHRGRLFLFGGFRRTWWDLDRETAFYHPRERRWTHGPPLPPLEAGEIALTHAGVASDGELVFVVAGQPGPRYGSACRTAWALHPPTGRWLRLPDLPVARYNPAACVVGRELHLFGGNLEDRATLCAEHWILSVGPAGEADLAVRESRLARATWRRGDDLPYLADHRGQVLIEGDQGPSLYLVGGEHGHAGLAPDDDLDAPPGSYLALPQLVRHDFTTGDWTRLADLPRPVHHVEHQVVLLGGRLLVLLGGAGDGSLLTDAIQVYDLETDRWTLHDTPMPTPLIGAVAWVEGERIVVNGGQTWYSPTDRSAGEVLATTWEVPFTLAASVDGDADALHLGDVVG